jgi:hypothetical protein
MEADANAAAGTGIAAYDTDGKIPDDVAQELMALRSALRAATVSIEELGALNTALHAAAADTAASNTTDDVSHECTQNPLQPVSAAEMRKKNTHAIAVKRGD